MNDESFYLFIFFFKMIIAVFKEQHVKLFPPTIVLKKKKTL